MDSKESQAIIDACGSNNVTLSISYRMQQTLQMDNDALAILTGRQPMVTGREGLADIKIVNAILEAAKTGRTVTL